MRYLFILVFCLSGALANYSIYYSGIHLGVIKDISTIEQNYLKVKITNSVARMLLGRRELIFYNSSYEGKKDNEKIKYKRDRYQVIAILQKSIRNQLKEGSIGINDTKFIRITKNSLYHFEYISKGKTKAQGDIDIKNQTLMALVDHKNHIKIIKN